MAGDLGPDAGLGAQTRHRDDGRQHAPDARGVRPRRICEQRAVLVVQDVYGQVWVRERELGLELAGEGLVDGVPETVAAGDDVLDVFFGGLACGVVSLV